MTIKKYVKSTFFVLLVLLTALTVLEKDSIAKDNHLKKSNKLIAGMRKSLNVVTRKIKKASDKSDISLINCLKQKEALIKTYINRSLRNQENLRSAWKMNDTKQADRFLGLIEVAAKKVEEIEAKLKECYKGELIEDKTKVRVIKPEGEYQDESLEELFPETETGEPEDLPLDPPASPYR